MSVELEIKNNDILLYSFKTDDTTFHFFYTLIKKKYTYSLSRCRILIDIYHPSSLHQLMYPKVLLILDYDFE